MAVDIFSGLLVSMLEQASAFVAGRKDQIRFEEGRGPFRDSQHIWFGALVVLNLVNTSWLHI